MAIETVPKTSSSKPIILRAISGFSSMGGSAALVEADETKILLDCGSEERSRESSDVRRWEKVSADVVLLSHAHLDHIGGLPLFLRYHPKVPVYATEPTRELAKLVLTRASGDISSGKPYTPNEVGSAVDSITIVPYNQKIRLGKLSFTFRPAGHLLGASVIHIEGSRKIIYTGDFSTHPTKLTKGLAMPPVDGSCDLLLCESTYGGPSPSSKAGNQDDILEEAKKVLRLNGRILVPTFALGRAQEVIVLFADAMARGILPKVPIYVDGHIRELNDSYLRLSEWFATPEAKKYLENDDVVKPVNRAERLRILFGRKPCIILAPSGSLTSGPSVLYAKDFGKRYASSIFFVAYLDEDSPAALLSDGLSAGKVVLGRDPVTISCGVKKFRFLAHADSEDVVNLAKACRPKFFVPMHGEQNARFYAAQAVERATDTHITVPYDGQALKLFPEDGRIEVVEGMMHNFSIEFLGELKAPAEMAEEEIYQALKKFIERKKVASKLDSPEKLRSFLWLVFRNCGNYVSTDPWRTVSDRARFFRACVKLLADVPGREQTFLDEFNHTAPAFLTNLVMYGANRMRSSKDKTVAIDSLEEAEALLVQFWKGYPISKPRVNQIYVRCKLRVGSRPEGDDYLRFKRIFEGFDKLQLLFHELRGLDYLVIGGTVAVASDGEMVLTLSTPVAGAAPGPAPVESSPDLGGNRLFESAGWRFAGGKTLSYKMAEIDGQYRINDEVRSHLAQLRHPTQEADSEEISEKEKVLQGLTRYGFTFTERQDCITCTHSSSGKTLLLVQDISNRFTSYASLPGVDLNAQRLASVIRRISWEWSSFAKSDAFSAAYTCASDLMSTFDWHEYLNEKRRRQALKQATECYSVQLISTSLDYVASTTFANDKEASSTIKADAKWLKVASSSWEVQLDRLRRTVVESLAGLKGQRFDRVIIFQA